ncbi:MAG: hypothetical protein LBV23_07560, partial [Deltaproteobacteria bacterium]|nr:hypothetical protein [Deltaproteobacteria bacterium]
MADNQPENPSASGSQETKHERLMDKFAELLKTYGDSVNESHLSECLKIIFTFEETFLKGISQSDSFFSFADIEELILEKERRFHDSNIKSLFQGMRR